MLETHLLTDAGQTAMDIAGLVAEFVAGARTSLDIALYDFTLTPATAAPVVAAIRDAVSRGVVVRLIYNVDHARPIPIPPPPRTDPDLIAATGAQSKPVAGVPDLMHHKYVVRDHNHVWTGSTNWTDDAWTREENIIIVLDSPPVAKAFTRDFESLWSTGDVAKSGKFQTQPAGAVTPRFCPGRAEELTERMVAAITSARRRIRVCSPVITASEILNALGSASADLAGVYDATQMHEVFGQWRKNPLASWKIPAFEAIVERAPFGGKRSTPYGPGTVHDYMHAKILVADDTVFTGSYNLSHSGQMNAENVVEIADAALAERLAGYIDEVRARYAR